MVLTAYSDPVSYNRIQLFKLSGSGEWLWKHNYPPISPATSDDANDLTVLSDGFLIGANCYYPDPQSGSVAFERPYYIKTDTNGNDLWRLVYGAVNGYHGFIGGDALHSSSGNFYSIGPHSNICDTPGLVKCMANGTEGYNVDLFPESCPGGSSQSLNMLNDTTFVTCVMGYVNGVKKVRWIKIDTMGTVKFFKEFPADDFIWSTSWSVVTFDKKIVGIAKHLTNLYLYKLNSSFEFDSLYIMPLVYDSACPGPVALTDTIDPACNLLVGVNEPEERPELTRLRARPNPVHDRLTVQLPEFIVIRQKAGQGVSSTTHNRWGTAELVAYDIFGTEVFAQSVEQSAKEAEIDVTGWKRGLYLFRLVFRNQTAGSVKVVVE